MADAKKPHVKAEAAGEGACTIIFVHGGACGREDWRFQVEELSTGFKVITLDLPGHGESEPPAIANVAALAQAVAAIVAQNAGRKIILAGHSLGCRVILETFRQMPNAIAALIFVDGSLSAREGDIGPVSATREKLREMGMDAFLDFSFRQMFVAGSDKSLVEETVSRARRWEAQLAEDILLDAIRFDACDSPRILASVDVPTLLLQSSSVDENFQRISIQPGMTTPWTELVLRVLPNSELRIVEGVGHFPHLEAAGAVNFHIADFAERVTSSAHRVAPVLASGAMT